MPNSKTHIAVGALTCGVTSIIYQKTFRPQQDIDWTEVLLWTGFGAVAGLLPDILEPATNPNHREFFHSIAFGGLVVVAGKKSFDKAKVEGLLKQYGINDNDREFLFLLLLMLIIAVISHLLLDSTTPKGLPFI